MENLPVKKVGVLSKNLLFDYVNQWYDNCGKPLWITPVEKSVEIVEKSRFSTGISWFSQLPDRAKNSSFRCNKLDMSHNL